MISQDRATAPASSAAWKLGMRSNYVWHRDDPGREADIAAERAVTLLKQRAGLARAEQAGPGTSRRAINRRAQRDRQDNS